jgi:hypothetical protein
MCNEGRVTELLFLAQQTFVFCAFTPLCALTHAVMLRRLHLSTCPTGWLPNMYHRMWNVLCLCLSQFVEVIIAVVF